MGTAALHSRVWLAPRRWWAALARVLQGTGSPRTGLGSRGDAKEKHPFDRRHGVDTDGLIYADGLASGHAHDAHNAGYYATAPSLFRGAMELWRETLPGTGSALEDYTLVDIGCGKGRVLMLATEYAFREVAGVELNPGLARVARKNLRRWMRWRWTRGRRACRNVRIVEGDALAVPLPDGPVALFYFNSFEREMAGMWLARLGEIARERTHPMDLIYVHPEFDSLVRQVPGVQIVAEAEIPFTEEDAGADVFGVTLDRCANYRFVSS
jgi:SAM-dependent methyltransferase